MKKSKTCEIQMNDAARKKRLGQYYSGSRLSRALAALACAENAKTVIDPMGGIGDMLKACRDYGGGIEQLISIEIDPIANTASQRNKEDVKYRNINNILGSCFDKKILRRLPCKSFDLVITNPPYVRYQSLSKAHQSDITIPSAIEIRSNLIEIVNEFPHLNSKDKELLSVLISKYSGLSDLAVPSWFLCAMLTRVGGTLAMVLPESWLTRDYAQIVQYLLLRWFRIRYIIEDTQAVWFPEALVKTTLLIAERIERKSSLLDCDNEGFLHVKVHGNAMNEKSIVGNQFSDNSNSEKLLSDLLQNLSEVRAGYNKKHLSASWIKTSNSVKNLLSSSKSEAWYKEVEGVKARAKESTWKGLQNNVNLPPALEAWLGSKASKRLVNLDEVGVQVSQGLRTGANQFFYVDVMGTQGKNAYVKPNPIIPLDQVLVPEDAIQVVLRRQSELGIGFRVKENELKGRVLALHGYALPEDIRTNMWLKKSYREMPESLASHVRLASIVNIGTESEAKRIPELSAVRTNVRASKSQTETMQMKFWYMLPEFGRRHRPDIFIPRINNSHPRAIMNAESAVLVDANFSTLWVESESESVLDKFSLLALLNSSWCIASMEMIASTMGGGALKLEATHIRRLPFPKLTKDQVVELRSLGVRLVSKEEAIATIQEIDRLVVSALVGESHAEKKYAQLLSLKRSMLKQRERKLK